MPSVSKRSRLFWWFGALILLTGLALHLWQLGRASLWYDEVITELYAQLERGDDEKQDWRSAAAFIEQEHQQEDALLVDVSGKLAGVAD